MNRRMELFKKYMNLVLDVILGGLAVLILLFMILQLWDVANYLYQPLSMNTFSVLMQEILSFFMLFEFVMMVLRYIEEDHHIPVRYLILICLTAILRQLMVLHDDGIQTLLLSISILLLVVVLYILKLNGNRPYFDFSSKKKEKNEDK